MGIGKGEGEGWCGHGDGGVGMRHVWACEPSIHARHVWACVGMPIEGLESMRGMGMTHMAPHGHDAMTRIGLALLLALAREGRAGGGT